MLLLGRLPEAAAQPREQCVSEHADAENHYLEGRFDEAVALLQTCLRRETLGAQEAEQVYRLLGLAYLNKDEPEQARQALRDLLKASPAYRADPIQDPPSYARLVDAVRQEVLAEAPPEAQPPPSDAAQDQADAQPPPDEGVPEVQPEPVEEAQDPPDAALPPVEEPVEPAREPVVEPVLLPPAQVPPRPLIQSPKSWLIATGGAVVLFTAAALLIGGGSSGGPASPPPTP